MRHDAKRRVGTARSDAPAPAGHPIRGSGTRPADAAATLAESDLGTKVRIHSDADGHDERRDGAWPRRGVRGMLEPSVPVVLAVLRWEKSAEPITGIMYRIHVATKLPTFLWFLLFFPMCEVCAHFTRAGVPGCSCAGCRSLSRWCTRSTCTPGRSWSTPHCSSRPACAAPPRGVAGPAAGY